MSGDLPSPNHPAPRVIAQVPGKEQRERRQPDTRERKQRRTGGRGPPVGHFLEVRRASIDGRGRRKAESSSRSHSAARAGLRLRTAAVRSRSGADQVAGVSLRDMSTTAREAPTVRTGLFGRNLLNKVPEVTIFFWIIKILCTTVGETGADNLRPSTT